MSHSPPPTTVDVGLESYLTRCVEWPGRALGEGEVLEATYNATTDSVKSVIVKDQEILTPEEIQQHRTAVVEARLGEISNLSQLGCFKRLPKAQAPNRLDTRWVIKWKWVAGKRIIKVRLAMRGFRDRGETYETFAGTASRWAQRIVNSIAVQQDGFVLFSFDVSSAFAKGMTFAELSRLTGEALRSVQFDLDREDVKLLRRIPGFETFDPTKETLDMVKPIYGLKDAPRAWRQKLHLLLVEWGLRRLYADAELYVCHEAVGAGARPQYVALPGPTSKPKQVKWSDQQKDTPTEVGKRR